MEKKKKKKKRNVRISPLGQASPRLFPLGTRYLKPEIVLSDILALSCFAKVANIEIITPGMASVGPATVLETRRNDAFRVKSAGRS